MKGDFSRLTFDPNKHFSSVRLQQGRVQLDADWNEWVDLVLYQMLARQVDALGPAGGPSEAPGFAISVSAGEDGQPQVQIGPGHYYVDGVLCQNENPLAYDAQPDNPGAVWPSGQPAALVAYLDVWQRHITAVQDDAIREVALGGPDTTTRTKTVWQVKLLQVGGEEEPEPPDEQEQAPAETGEGEGSSPGDAPPDQVEESAQAEAGSDEDESNSLPDLLAQAEAVWTEFRQKQQSAGRLAARVSGVGSRMQDNQLYRVEIHAAGQEGKPIFKWSRDNGSVVFPILNVQQGDTLLLTVDHLAQDPARLQPNDWVEYVDDEVTLSNHGFPLLRVTAVDPQYGRVTLAGLPDDGSLPAFDAGKHPLLRRWDHHISQAEANPNEQIAEPGSWQALEHGLEIHFDGQGPYRRGDYWLVPMRRRLANIIWPRSEGQPAALPPAGPGHHFAPLAALAPGEEGWLVADDWRQLYDTAPQLTAGVAALRVDTGDLRDDLADLRRLVESMLRNDGIYRSFSAGEELSPGTVVALNLGDLDTVSPAGSENARLLAGVVVESLWDEGESGYRYLVQLYGQAKVNVRGPIEPGDPLAPGDQPGLAERGRVYMPPGTILGKALSSFTPADGADTGQVEALVTLS